MTLKLKGSDVYVRGPFGFLQLKLGGPLLNDRLAEAISYIPLAEIRTRFDLGLPAAS